MKAPQMAKNEITIRSSAAEYPYLCCFCQIRNNFEMRFYNLQAIIVVEFKVNNERAVRFHRWAGQIVKD